MINFDSAEQRKCHKGHDISVVLPFTSICLFSVPYVTVTVREDRYAFQECTSKHSA